MAGSALRVLVVDDEGLIRWSVREILSGVGHIVSEAGNGATARSILKRSTEPIDVVLLDYRLPDSNDLGLLQDVRRLSPSSTVIMMTAHRTSELTDAATASGAECVIDKPFDLQLLEPLVRQAGESARVRASKQSLRRRHHSSNQEATQGREADRLKSFRC